MKLTVIRNNKDILKDISEFLVYNLRLKLILNNSIIV